MRTYKYLINITPYPGVRRTEEIKKVLSIARKKINPNLKWPDPNLTDEEVISMEKVISMNVDRILDYTAILVGKEGIAMIYAEDIRREHFGYTQESNARHFQSVREFREYFTNRSCRTNLNAKELLKRLPAVIRKLHEIRQANN